MPLTKNINYLSKIAIISCLLISLASCSKFKTVDNSDPTPNNQTADIPNNETPPISNNPPPPEETTFNKVNLAWDYPKERTTPTTSIETDLSGYKVSRGTKSGVYDFDYPLIDPALRTVQLTDLKLNTTYYFAIKAVGKLDEESAYSNEVQFPLSGSMKNHETLTLSENTREDGTVQNLSATVEKN